MTEETKTATHFGEDVFGEEAIMQFSGKNLIVGGRAILIDKFLTRAIELDVDCVSDGETTVVGAILEHIEAAGCHSGDAAAVTPPVSLAQETIDEVARIAARAASSSRCATQTRPR